MNQFHGVTLVVGALLERFVEGSESFRTMARQTVVKFTM